MDDRLVVLNGLLGIPHRIGICVAGHRATAGYVLCVAHTIRDALGRRWMMKLSEQMREAWQKEALTRTTHFEWADEVELLEGEIETLKKIKKGYREEAVDYREKIAQLEEENTSLEERRNTAYEECSYLTLQSNRLREEKIALKRENEALMMAANSFLGLIDCLGGRGSLDDAGPDGKNLAELVNYPDYMNEKLALLTDTQESE